MITIKGLDKLQRDLDEAGRAFEAIDGELGSVRFDPDDAESIEHAIIGMEALIDERLGDYASNPIVAPLIGGLKERCREGIVARAAEARLGGSNA